MLVPWLCRVFCVLHLRRVIRIDKRDLFADRNTVLLPPYADPVLCQGIRFTYCLMFLSNFLENQILWLVWPSDLSILSFVILIILLIHSYIPIIIQNTLQNAWKILIIRFRKNIKESNPFLSSRQVLTNHFVHCLLILQYKIYVIKIWSKCIKICVWDKSVENCMFGIHIWFWF